MLRPLITAIVLVASLTACDKFPGKGDKKDAAAAPAKLTIAPEDILAVQSNALASGSGGDGGRSSPNARPTCGQRCPP
jgi:membrane fusion protein (multidrug efflux system)